MTMKKLGTVVIGGGSGFIGSALTAHLMELGYSVRIISRTPGIFCMTWAELLKDGFPESTEAVISLAGQNVLDPKRRWTAGFMQNVWASRVKTTGYLTKVIKESKDKPKVFVSMSGVGYYKPSAVEEYTESSLGGNFDFLSRLCSDWEEAAELPSNLNVRVVKIRSGVVLGRSGGMIQQLYLPFFMGLGGPIGSGQQFMPWIHLDDIVGLIVHAITCENVSGVMNGVAPQIITNRQFAKTFGKAMWRPAVLPLAVPIVNVIFGKERATIMTEGQRVLPTVALNSGYKFQYPDIESAAKEFSRLFI